MVFQNYGVDKYYDSDVRSTQYVTACSKYWKPDEKDENYLGDPFQAWSNSRIRPCCHRVMMRRKKTRISVGLFMLRKGVIHVPDERYN
ncbi:hypothetical protein Pint_29996 [Pistacia integerrima]|uniref:Uncharacterized protein n=1 Tax=Pistacia integerrima TaxID=434235 RepID=A0ACC0X2G7_9ROSI|nr:hypothetical protein Pint_29996 [Pistacia integerrima]